MRILLIILLISNKANALTIGTGLTYTKNNEVSHQQHKPNITIGETLQYQKIIIAFNTNRLNARSNNLILKNGLKLKQKVRYDALQVCYLTGRLFPCGILSNVEVERKFLNQKTTNHLIVYGASLNYMLTENVIFGVGGIEGQTFFTNITYRL